MVDAQGRPRPTQVLSEHDGDGFVAESFGRDAGWIVDLFATPPSPAILQLAGR